MIIISKKRIEIIISCLIIGLFTFSFGVANKQEKNSSKNQIEELTNNNSVETVAVPISGKTIVVDARTWCSR